MASVHSAFQPMSRHHSWAQTGGRVKSCIIWFHHPAWIGAPGYLLNGSRIELGTRGSALDPTGKVSIMKTKAVALCWG